VLAIYEAGSAEPQLPGLPPDVARVDVFNKTDLVPDFIAPACALRVSAKTGAGIEALRARILEAAGWSSTGEDVFLARERHLRGLQAAREHIAAAGREVRRAELAAEELRLAQHALGAVVGEFSADDLLGEIFARFCIGK
jgi:tRNA modification GTPase